MEDGQYFIDYFYGYPILGRVFKEGSRFVYYRGGWRIRYNYLIQKQEKNMGIYADTIALYPV